MRILLIRHGQTAWNVEGRMQGHTDLPLDEEGLRQASRLGERLRGTSLQTVLTSDLQRSVQTAEQVAGAAEAPLEKLPGLREISLGIWEGKLWREIAEERAASLEPDDPHGFEFAPPQGETYPQAWERLGPVVDRLRQAPRPLAVVTHGVIGAILLARLLGGTLVTAKAFHFGNTAVTELLRGPDGLFRLVRFNCTSHLDAVPVTETDAARH